MIQYLPFSLMTSTPLIVALSLPSPARTKVRSVRRHGRSLVTASCLGPVHSDICPVLWPQRVKRGRKHDTLLHVHVLPLLLNEVGNDVVHGLAQEILVAQHALDRLSDPAQTPRSLLMLGFELTDGRR